RFQADAVQVQHGEARPPHPTLSPRGGEGRVRGAGRAVHIRRLAGDSHARPGAVHATGPVGQVSPFLRSTFRIQYYLSAEALPGGASLMEVLIPADRIRERVAELARQIARDYHGRPV